MRNFARSTAVGLAMLFNASAAQALDLDTPPNPVLNITEQDVTEGQPTPLAKKIREFASSIGTDLDAAGLQVSLLRHSMSDEGFRGQMTVFDAKTTALLDAASAADHADLRYDLSRMHGLGQGTGQVLGHIIVDLPGKQPVKGLDFVRIDPTAAEEAALPGTTAQWGEFWIRHERAHAFGANESQADLMAAVSILAEDPSLRPMIKAIRDQRLIRNFEGGDGNAADHYGIKQIEALEHALSLSPDQLKAQTAESIMRDPRWNMAERDLRGVNKAYNDRHLVSLMEKFHEVSFDRLIADADNPAAKSGKVFAENLEKAAEGSHDPEVLRLKGAAQRLYGAHKR